MRHLLLTKIAPMNRRNFLFSTSIPAATVLMGGIPQGHSKPIDPIGTFKPLVQRDRLPNPVIIQSLELYERDGNWFIRAHIFFLVVKYLQLIKKLANKQHGILKYLFQLNEGLQARNLYKVYRFH